MELNFKVYGAGPPLVICHGLFGMLDNWQSLAKIWAQDFTVYVVDQRNHGKSPHTSEFNYALLAEDLAAFMESQWMYEAFLLGHSMGGKTVMQTAIDFPDMVEKMVVVDMGPEANEAGHHTIFDAMLSLPLDQLKSRGEAEELLAKQIKERGTRQFLMKNLSRKPAGGFRWKMNLTALKANYPEILAPISAAVYEGPSLFIRGGKSDYLPETLGVSTLDRFPSAEMHTIASAGHWVHADQPAELAEVVRQFLLEK